VIQFSSSTEARKSRKNFTLRNGTNYWRSDYLISSLDKKFPASYLIEQEPESVILPHFHEANQFQLFVSGNGTIGKQMIEPISLHYSDCYSPYGPIISGSKGLSYFTLRDEYDPGAQFMPESRGNLVCFAEPRQHFLVENIQINSNEILKTYHSKQIRSVYEEQPNGLAAYILGIGPEMTVDGPEPTKSGGQYYIVMNGTIIYKENELPLWSCFFISPNEKSLEVHAGLNGLEVLILQFPRKEAVSK
jgi:hypothetical protein